MKKLSTYIAEQKNTHMSHVEDLVFDQGVNGARRAINFLRDLRDMLACVRGEYFAGYASELIYG